MKKLDYYNREIKVGDLVNLDHEIGISEARVIGFTSKRVKVRKLFDEREVYINPLNLTIIND
tara:strand:+ start:954 stop:1139 length:186 start_codon:yes stop_codon:yes gene_type:complete